MPDAMKNTISVNDGSGKNFHKSLFDAIAMTLPAPPARSAENIAMIDRPITSTIIWMKSVHATARKPPITTYTSTASVPTIMPVVSDIAPLVSTENTRPSAVICAATQPR